MLQDSTVEPNTLALLRALQSLPILQDFYLVGGTALSLLYGHRRSDDLDLFNNENFRNEGVLSELQRLYGDSLSIRQSTSFGIFCRINNVKVDLVRFSHPVIRPPQTIDRIRMYSVEDIIAMKVQAVLGRGRKKDFWDIAELLQHYSVQDFISFHQEKFSTQNLLITVPQAITYFRDADSDADPISLKEQSWSDVKSFISHKVREYLS